MMHKTSTHTARSGGDVAVEVVEAVIEEQDVLMMVVVYW